MEQELIYKNVAVIGCGAAGGFASVLLCKNPQIRVTAFDIKEPFETLLPTGGGRCNLTYDEKDIREFVQNYPRGEKFLLSVYSKFDNAKTRQLFKELGIKTYVQDDKRVFPVSDSSKKLISDLKKHLDVSNFCFKQEKVRKAEKKNDIFCVETENGQYEFDVLILSTGGKGNGFEIADKFGHNVIPHKPSLTSFEIKEKYLYALSGMSFKNVEITINSNKQKNKAVIGDILFTHSSISGPAIFKVSAITAFDKIDENNCLEISLKLADCSLSDIEEELKANSKKTIKNVFSKFVPENYIAKIMQVNGIDESKQVAQIKKTEKEILINAIICLKLHLIGRKNGSEIVTAGGVDLNEVCSKTMESKIVKNLYIIGEVLNIDGYTGGFNLQNCWSTAFIAVSNINYCN